MSLNREHDHYVAKNRSLALANEMETRDKKLEKQGHSHLEREASCFNCKLKSKCPQFRVQRTGSISGVASVGGNASSYLCDKYVPMPAESRGMDNKKIKSLMKQFKRS